MAKQSGIHQLRGKVGNMKYYGMKGVDGGLVQSINEGMSNRVKTGAEYANTRRNNSEFGMAASTAGAAVKSLSQRWRYILKPFQTGMLAKEVLNLAKLTGSGAWGERFLAPEILQSFYPTAMAKAVKNDVSDFGNLVCHITSIDSGARLNLDSANVRNEKAESSGCTGVTCVFVGGYITPSFAGSLVDPAIAATQRTEILGEIHVPFGNNVEESMHADIITEGYKSGDSAAIGYVVLLPFREIGGERVVMQEFASVIFAAPAA